MRRSARLWLGCAALWCLCAAGRPARAQEVDERAGSRHPEVAAVLDPCVPVDAAQFHRILAIELGQDVRYRPEGDASPGATWISVGCSEGGIALSLRDGVTRKDMERALPVAPLRQQSGARLLALAVAEFVVASWIELDVQPEPAVEPLGPPSTAAQRRRVTRTVRRRLPSLPTAGSPTLELGGAFTTQIWSSHDGVLLGGELRLVHELLRHLAWSAGAGFRLTRLRARQGHLELGTASAAAALLLHLRLSDLHVHAGPGWRIGVVRMQGLAGASPGLAGDTLSGPFGGPLLYVRNGLALGDGVRLVVDLEAGLVALEAQALDEVDRPLLSLEGVWIGAGLGLSAVF